MNESNPASNVDEAKLVQDGDVYVTTQPLAGLPAGERLLTIPDVAERMGVVVTKVFDMLRNKQLLAVRINDIRYVPEVFFGDRGELNKFVPGVIALLTDGGYSNQEIVEYLFREDDSLPGRPANALQGHLAREVMRRAQAMAF